jgi:hypothetical protein
MPTPTGTSVDKGKHIGRVRALTTLSPVLPDRESALRRGLRLVRLIPNAGRPLQQLAFIHYGRWTVLRDVPVASGSGDRRPLNHRYLMFESNYDGGVSDYLDAFADTVPHRLARLWGTCVDFEDHVMGGPGAERREVSPPAFRQYVSDNELEVLHFYAAYPKDTVVAVRQAIEFEARITAPAPDVVELEAAATGPAPDGAGPAQKVARIVRDWRASAFRRYGVEPLTAIFPIKDLERLREVLRAFEDGTSPFSLPATHYARLVLMPPDLKNLGQDNPERLDTHYLLFSSTLSGDAAAYIEALGGNAIWECCAGYPGRDDRDAFARWFGCHGYKTNYFVAGYTAHEPATIRRYVDTRMDIAAIGGQPSETWLEQALARRAEARDGH